MFNGIVQKVVVVKVKPYELMPRENVEEKDDKNEKSTDKDENEVERITNDQNDDLEEMENEIKEEIDKDAVGANNLRKEQSVCFMENAIFTVEVPVSEHNKPEIIEARKK